MAASHLPAVTVKTTETVFRLMVVVWLSGKDNQFWESAFGKTQFRIQRQVVHLAIVRRQSWIKDQYQQKERDFKSLDSVLVEKSCPRDKLTER